MPHTPSYSSGRITLLGDAAHASTSHAGAGAGMAVEDALILSEVLSDPRTSSLDDIPTVFAAYNTVRRPRTQRLVQHSRESGMLFQLRKPGVEDDLEKLKVDLETRQRWIWDMNMEDHLEEAKKELWETSGNISN
jgi:salicylate hydroxylase